MRIVLQRVTEASVDVDGETVGAIERGVLLLVGIERGDTEADVEVLAGKVSRLRMFPDETGERPMHHTLADVGGACLVVSQFTLLASLKKGNRPGFSDAEDPPRAAALCEAFAARLRALGLPVETGRFGAAMAVGLVNDGPVTLLLEARDGKVR